MPNHLILRVIAEIAHQILLALALVVFMPAGVQDQNVAVVNLRARFFDHLRRDRRPVGNLRRQIDHDAVADQKIER